MEPLASNLVGDGKEQSGRGIGDNRILAAIVVVTVVLAEKG